MSDLPPLPQGFTLDSAASGSTPPLPQGFTLDTAAPDETVGRVSGLTGRALASGAAALPSSIINLTNPVAAVARSFEPSDDDGKPYEPKLSDFIHPDKWHDAVNFLADKAGLASPATPGERIYSKAVEALPSAVLAPEAPVAGAIGSMAGGAASQGVAEAGGSPVQQTLAGLAVGSIPAAASGIAQGGRALLRNADDTAARIADAQASGTQLTAGQATNSKILQSVEGASSKIWGGGPIKATAEQQADDLSGRVGSIVDNLAAGGDVSPTGAGTAINAGAKQSVANMRAAEQAAYDKVDALVPPKMPVSVSNALGKLDTLAAPTPGAEATTGALVSQKIAAMRDNLAADAAKNDGQLPYDAVKQLRSAVGANIDHGFAPADPSTNAAFKQVYGALSDDMSAGASAVSPEAKQAAADASALYKTNSGRREFLDSVVDKAGGPEAVFQAATNGTKQGATKIGGVMNELDPGQQNLVRATVLDRLGKAPAGQQGADGATFNPSTYLTNWSKLAPEAKDAIFGAGGKANSLRSGLDSLSNTMATIRNSTVFKNPSGTGEAVGHGLGLAALLEGGGHLLAGHPAPLAAAGSAIAGNAILSRALTNPRTVAWLAQTAKLPTSALPNAVNQLGKFNDPDASALAGLLQSK